MDTNQNFSDVPSLEDQAGLEALMQAEQLKAAGVTPPPVTNPGSTQQPAGPAVPPVPPAAPAVQQAANPAANPAATPAAPNADASQLAIMNQQIEQLKAQVEAQKQIMAQRQAAQPAQPAYSPQVRAFIQEALNRGYSMDQIQRALASRQNPAQAQLAQKVAAIEKAMLDQQNAALQQQFITKMTTFGDQWGLTEKDLVYFCNKAMENGINVANENVNLDAVFRAIFPEQYAIRSQRMRATPASQIYGGASTPNNPNAQANKVADAMIDDFLRKAMPAQYSQFINKK